MEFELIIEGKVIKIKEGDILSFGVDEDAYDYLIFDIMKKPFLNRNGKIHFSLKSTNYGERIYTNNNIERMISYLTYNKGKINGNEI